MDSKVKYSSLPQEVLSVGHRIGLKRKTDNNNIVESYVESVLPKGLFESDLRFTTYLLNERHNTFNTRHKDKKCSNGLTAKQRKRLFALSKSDINYEMYDKINDLWHKYMDSLMDEIKSKADQIKLIRADFHGSYLIVCASKNPTLVGVKGYVVQESKNTFKMVTKDNRLLTVPKDNSMFAFEHNGVISKLNGHNLKMSSHNRSKAKPKFKLNEILINI